MKLYAQHGHAPADKMRRAAEDRFIDGVIISPRFTLQASAREMIAGLRVLNPQIDIILDPEFYAISFVGTPNAQLRYLDQWPHFVQRRRNDLLVGTASVDETLQQAFRVQMDLDCSLLIAPNIYVSNSFDSIEAAISIAFVSRAQIVAAQMGVTLPVYTTIAVSKDAMINRNEYVSFLNALTAVEPAPEGVYILVGSGPTDARLGTSRSEIMVPEVIGGWMMLNYTLALNGFRTINGCSDILTPLLGITRGHAGATGWWSNLQVFSMGRYIKGQAGGQLPIVRYFSKSLLNRITINRLEAYVEIVGSIMNGLTSDRFYEGGDPNRTEEALQSWQALGALNAELITGNLNDDLERFDNHVSRAVECYEELRLNGFSEGYEANIEYLQTLNESVRIFRELAEI
ncbi:MAG: hypothetical protein QME66_09465 [Candidatus Eisenbacteria bacterium]|nr:hypothetical protein [Candidatus Eisenbacteria bacterium]